jgi:hypothetical protein
MTIAGLTGVRQADAGVASGLINTSRQIGGAIGIAAVSTIAAGSTRHYAASHAGATLLSAGALTHGFQVAFYVLGALAIVGALVSAVFIESRERSPEVELVAEPAVVDVEKAA